ncbi:hypothetical protein CORC01_09670 [Colletotrichum orchidophilum]|uniref:Uncharacterized protein n=1 Tax=Colletotrichum orchidophilum TaxID=1209926 RepID=A0A1G4B0Y9_9PEZI|nr:uncharacterized protein CORC01_09670 [Colletotrichum orchidophilum]OHE95013.1 hypothetical protein CORC01_09670 [Colletotrichum orchidophilum]
MSPEDMRCPNVVSQTFKQVEKLCDACVQEPANVEAMEIGPLCRQWTDLRVAVPLAFMPPQLKSALSKGIESDAEVETGEFVLGDTLKSPARSGSHVQPQSSQTPDGGPDVMRQLRDKSNEVNRLLGSLQPVPNIRQSKYPQIIGLEHEEFITSNPFDIPGSGGRIRDSSHLWNQVSPYGAIRSEVETYRQMGNGLAEPAPEVLKNIAADARRQAREDRVKPPSYPPSPLGPIGRERQELRQLREERGAYAKRLVESWVQQRNE